MRATRFASVLKSEPDWTALPASVPASIRTLIRRCLEKDRRQRIEDIAVARFVLDEPATDGAVVPTAARRGGRLAWVAALVVLAAVAVALAVPPVHTDRHRRRR
jgi:serine/threonine-protein kinase